MKVLFCVLLFISILFTLPSATFAQMDDEDEVVADEEMEDVDEEADELPEYFLSISDWKNLEDNSKTNIVLGIYMGSIVGDCMLDGSVMNIGSVEKRKLRRYLLEGWNSSPDTFSEEVSALIDDDTYRISGAFVRAEANFAKQIGESKRAAMLIDSAKFLERHYPPENDKGLIGNVVDTVESWNSLLEANEQVNFATGFLNGIHLASGYADAGERTVFSFRVGQYVTEMNKVAKTYADENEDDYGVGYLMMLAHDKLEKRIRKK